jgi:hypothetical protein
MVIERLGYKLSLKALIYLMYFLLSVRISLYSSQKARLIKDLDIHYSHLFQCKDNAQVDSVIFRRYRYILT